MKQVSHLLLTLTFLGLASAAFATPSSPKLFFQYSQFYDKVCAKADNVAIVPAAAKEATDRTGEFQTIWENDGPVLLDQVFKTFNRGIARKELTATLSVCVPGTSSSFSDPLTINVANYIQAYDKSKTVWENYKFVDSVFHEVLHKWVNENLDKACSPLLKKYASESPRLKAHLHMFALQILTYKNLNRQNTLDWISQLYTGFGDAEWHRAWNIVNTEGYQAFIGDLTNCPLPN